MGFRNPFQILFVQMLTHTIVTLRGASFQKRAVIVRTKSVIFRKSYFRLFGNIPKDSQKACFALIQNWSKQLCYFSQNRTFWNVGGAMINLVFEIEQFLWIKLNRVALD